MKNELKKRTFIKSIVWRFIGIIWTWAGTYFILLITPKEMKSPAFTASIIVIYHHSTRMVMYYFYERFWNKIKWGIC